MKMKEAMDLIEKVENPIEGYYIHFEWCGDGFLWGDYFPDKCTNEPLLKSEEEAWELARRFANATQCRTCNIYVTDSKFNAVPRYKEKEEVKTCLL